MPCFYVFFDNGFVGGRFLVCASKDLKADYKSLCKIYEKKNISLRFVYENCIEDEERWRDDIFDTYLCEGYLEKNFRDEVLKNFKKTRSSFDLKHYVLDNFENTLNINTDDIRTFWSNDDE